MKTHFTLAFGLTAAAGCALAVAATGGHSATLAQQPIPVHTFDIVPSAPTVPHTDSAFTYQGQLRRQGLPVTAYCNAGFSLWNSASGGTQIGPTVTSATLTVRGGFFTIPLDFGWGALNGEARWLEVAVGCGETPTTLAPRTALRPAPYAFALPGLRTEPAAPDYTGNPTVNIIAGVITGTKTNTISVDSQDSVIAGGSINAILDGSEDSVIPGGYSNRISQSGTSFVFGGSNTITDSSGHSFIGGGRNNGIRDYSSDSTIAGGLNNVIDRNSYEGAIGGGGYNMITGSHDSVIAGGVHNSITDSSVWSAIGGGDDNTIDSAVHAVIPGGASNRVEGDYGFAAGRRAVALHNGAFVWGDATGAGVTSTAMNQFVVRASNGLILPVDAGEAKSIAIGERYRDNALVAWGKVGGDGSIGGKFGVSSVAKGATGVYTVTLTATAVDASSLVPTATAEVDEPPSGPADMRVAMINQVTTKVFVVYVVNGSGTPVNNDFTFMVTAR